MGNINQIPHIIHYCWFGGKEKPASIQKYIDGWKAILPDYQLMEWNEDNFDIDNAPQYVKEAYSVGKFAFVSDYARVVALYEHGGVYLDTDIEIVKRFDEIIDSYEMVLGFESDLSLETAFIACSKNCEYMADFVKSYEGRRFIMDDGSYDMSVINAHFSKHMQQFGVDLSDESLRTVEDGKIAIYPREYFAAFDISNWHEKPTDKTFTIHHMNSSWGTGKARAYFKTIKIIQTVIGVNNYDRLKGLYDKARGR